MIYKTYELITRLSAQAVAKRIENLLSKEGVRFRSTGLSITSTRTPLVVLSIQPKLYSRSNWVGVNPFIYISGVDVQLVPDDSGTTRVMVRLNRIRALLFAAVATAFAFPVACALPEPTSVLFFAGYACAAWFGIVSFLGSYLVKKEISDCLNDR